MPPGTINGSPLTVGVGFSPGDSSYHEPYWPESASLSALAGQDFWHIQHWVGEVLWASRLAESVSAEVQQQVRVFLHVALSASICLLKSASLAEV